MTKSEIWKYSLWISIGITMIVWPWVSWVVVLCTVVVVPPVVYLLLSITTYCMLGSWPTKKDNSNDAQ